MILPEIFSKRGFEDLVVKDIQGRPVVNAAHPAHCGHMLKVLHTRQALAPKFAKGAVAHEAQFSHVLFKLQFTGILYEASVYDIILFSSALLCLPDPKSLEGI